jgi:hypothetical protein
MQKTISRLNRTHETKFEKCEMKMSVVEEGTWELRTVEMLGGRRGDLAEGLRLPSVHHHFRPTSLS